MTYINEHITWERKYEGAYLVNGEIWFGYLSEEACEIIRAQHCNELIFCYIDPTDLVRLAADHGVAPSVFFQDEILPDRGSIKSGDSGEIIARSVVQERDDNPRIPAYRWRNKSHKNDTVRGPDLLGYVLPDADNPSQDDTLVIVEVKTRSVTVDQDVVTKAYEGVHTHYISRLTNSLIFLQHWLLRQGEAEEASRLSRFSNPHETPYTKRLVACVVHNHANWQDEFLEKLPIQHELDDSVGVLIISIENLYEWIDLVHRGSVEALGNNDGNIRD